MLSSPAVRDLIIYRMLALLFGIARALDSSVTIYLVDFRSAKLPQGSHVDYIKYDVK